jgi:hypothetical protein
MAVFLPTTRADALAPADLLRALEGQSDAALQS